MRNPGLRVVAAVEATKGLLVLAVGAGLFSLVHRDVQSIAEHFVRAFHLNPASRTPRVFLELAANLTSSRLQLLALGATAYASLHLVEAWGLWRGMRWAEWLGVVAGGLYVPFEVYELTKSATWVRLVVFVVNVAIVAYLASVLWRARRKSRPAQLSA
ncbi:MAG TPA: DUF2127 domain-containing protein [Burkholderiales bacterium]|nr:DUF2127 domain-containing protein [Burkholderiales bacterium]